MLFNAVTVHTVTPVEHPWQQRLDTLRELFSDVGCFALVAAGTLCVAVPTLVSPYPHQTYFSIGDVEATREYLRGHLPAGSEVTSTWPGYVAGTGHRPSLGLESTLSLDVAKELSPGMREQVHVMTLAELYDHINAARPDAVVINAEDETWWGLRPERIGQYVPVFKSGSVIVLLRRPRA